ncbi:MAG: DEAD/DEAH box helicase [Planctomycetes bacterium]|nr:DEAD/DEAH box helicase [Planctomycetota bacterium]
MHDEANRNARTFKGLKLNAFQTAATESIDAGHSVLISAPTGAGKTLVAEYAIAHTLEEGQRAIYTAPIKALSNQKYRDFRDDPDVEVGLMTGDVTLNPDAPLLIMTTEIFRNTIFEAPERFHDVGFLIFDEIHYLDDLERGTVWEESLIFAPEDIRLVCLSATIQNLDSFGAWIRSVRKQEIDVIHDERRPVPLEHWLYHGATGAFRYSDWKAMQRKVQSRSSPRTQSRAPRGARGGRPGRGRSQQRGAGRREGTGISPHVASRMLLDDVVEAGTLPVLYFCFSRRECEIKAERNRERQLLKKTERTRLARLFEEICELFQLDVDRDPALLAIRERAMHGIGFHHAGMLPIHKEVVERLFTSGLLKMLFTTETFALGINMPARAVCFDSLKKFDGVSFDYMKRRDYLQMAGRAGRQGIDDSGLVYSVLDDDAMFEAPLKRILYGESEPIVSRFNLSYSTLINLYARTGRKLVEAYEKSFAWYQLQRKGSEKRREKLRRLAKATIHHKLDLLEEAGYLDPSEGLLPRARIARQINGYEIQIAELLFDGILDELDADELAGVFVALVYEARRGDSSFGRPSGKARHIAHRVETAVRRFTSLEVLHGFEDTLKLPDFGLWDATLAWCGGADFEDLEDVTSSSSGDIVRTFRMAIQMLRQLQHALTRDYALHQELETARIRMNRDVVDAKRQLELG